MVTKETEYRGILFRSRLEARVALFFDKAGIEWIYEPDRIVNGDSEYNPDFYLPKTDDYVEVKGKRPGYEKEILKAREHLIWGGEIKRLVIISEIPDPTQIGMPHFPCYYLTASRRDNIDSGWYFFQDEADGHVSAGNYRRPYINKWNLDNKYSPFDISPVTDYILKEKEIWYEIQDESMKKSNEITFAAYAAARKADFTMRRVG